MSRIIDFLIGLLGHIMSFCYGLTGNYGLSIILFTLITKLFLFPIGLLTQKNAIRMAQLQPELDQLRMKYVDDKDKFADAQLELYKKYKYNPFLDVLPLCLQIPLVLGLIGVVYRPLNFILHLDEQVISTLKERLFALTGETDAGNLYQMKIIEAVRTGAVSPEGISEEAVNRIMNFSMFFAGIDLGRVPYQHILDPVMIVAVFAGISAALLCFAQNKINVLQMAQGKTNKILTTLFMVSFSLYFAMIVPGSIGLYWIAGNLFAIPVMLLTNTVLPPKKYVDYERLLELKALRQKKDQEYRKYSKREKEDYRRFFANGKKQLMVYSEQNGFYKYFSGIIDYICEHSDIVIHYVTSDPDDLIFKDEREQIKAYYVASDRYLIPLFMKLDADMCLMTMPDLEKYHIKRSRVRDDVEYVFVCHGIGSITTYRRGALDWFDTVLCPNADQEKEIRAYEKLYGTPEKLLVETGYPLIDQMIREYQNTEHEKHDVPQIIIAPSWQKDNIIDMCLEELLDGLLKSGFQIIVRPHPQQVRHEPERFEMLKTRYNDYGNVEIETDFSKNRNVFESDILITDWSGIAFEYAFVTRKPVVYIDTPMKVMNNDYEQIGIEPLNKTIRTSIGEVIPVEQVSEARQIIEKMIDSKDYYEEKITQELEKHLYNVGRSSEISGRYIIKALKKRI